MTYWSQNQVDLGSNKSKCATLKNLANVCFEKLKVVL